MLHPNEQAGILICSGVALLCVIIGLVLLSGHGAMMIAGYNTATKEKREKINEKALCKAVGIFVIAIGVIIGLIIPAAYWSIAWLVYALMALIIISSILLLIYINKSKRFKK